MIEPKYIAVGVVRCNIFGFNYESFLFGVPLSL